MGKVLTFPRKRIAPVAIKDRIEHSVSLEVRDNIRPRRTRWAVQFEIQEAASIPSIKGFTDVAVAAGYRHCFKIDNLRKLRQFIAQTSHLVASGDIALWIDGSRVRPQIQRRA